MNSTTIRILVADDHKIIRDSLKMMINRKPGMEVIACAENGRKAVELSRTLTPTIVIMDVMMPDMNGIDATRIIVGEEPGIKVIGLSMFADQRHIRGMLKVGASGYLCKGCSCQELITAIREVAQGRIYLSPQVAEVVAGSHRDRMKLSAHAACAALTPREKEVLQLVAEGLMTKEIAAYLQICIKTTETHIRNMQSRLGIHGRARLTKYAVREGLVSIEG